MLATLSEPFDAEGWLYEVKWDGYRAIAKIDRGDVVLESRHHISFHKKFYPVYEALKAWNIHGIVDGEIVAMNKSGKIQFNALQNWTDERDGSLFFYVFDLLWLDGYDLTQMPIEKRRILLQERIPDSKIIRFSENLEASASQLLNAAAKKGMEGIIAKRKGSAYYPGERSAEWLKMKRQQRQEVVIGGYIRLEDSPKPFSSLLVGVYENQQFRYVGKVGTGFSHTQQKEMLRLFEPLIRDNSPFEVVPLISKPKHFHRSPRGMKVTFLNPELVCEVNYTEITTDGLMRHPAFVGMREDKPAKEVIQERPEPPEKLAATHKTKAHTMNADTHKSKPLFPETARNLEVTVNGHVLKCTNLDKLYWKEDKITKRDLLNYYHAVAPYILPYLKNRPMSLNRHPDGYQGPSFYQKDVKDKAPEWIETLSYRSEEEADIEKEFLVCTNEASLLYMANLGCIEINPWSSTTDHPDHPDWCLLDIDPDKKNSFDEVIEVALLAHELLEQAGVPSYCKTSGSTGLHVYIPLDAKYTYDQSQDFARFICTLIQAQMPEITSIERAVTKRKGMIYLDFLQNRTQATLAAPYSVRPKPHATVSMPLEWKDVKKGLKIEDFTLRNSIEHIEKQGDLFKNVLGKGADLMAALEKLESAWQNV